MEKRRTNVTAPLKVAGASIAMGVVGEKIGFAPLTEAGSVAAKFVKPMVNVSMGDFAIRVLRRVRKK